MERQFPKSNRSYPKLLVVPSPYPRASSGFSSLARSQHMSKFPSSRKIGLHAPLFPSLWRKFSIGVHQLCTP